LAELTSPQPAAATRAPSWSGFFAVACALFAVILSSTLPTALYSSYAARYGFGSGTVTLLFAVFVTGILIVLTAFGSLSDRVGRRVVLLGAMAAALAGSVLLCAADDVTVLFLGRFLQGVAAGLVFGAGTAALVDLHPRRDRDQAALTSTVANVAAQATGAILGGVFGEWLPLRLRLVWLVYVALLIPVTFLIWRLPDDTPAPGRRRTGPGTLGVPAEMRPLFLACALGAFAMSAVLGLYSSLTPTFLSTLLDLSSLALAGAVAFLLMFVSGLTQLALRSLKPRAAGAAGLVTLTAGMIAVTTAATIPSLPLLLGGTVVAGFGQGLAFMGLLAAVSRASPDERRAGIISAFYIAAWLGAALPVLGVGYLAPAIGLLNSVKAFTALIALLSLLAATAVLGKTAPT
jgi:predicted MFS family arabinose efflux permease